MMMWFAVDPRDQLIVFEEWPETSFYETPNPGFGVAGYADLIQSIERGDNFHEHPITNVIWRIMDPNFGRTKSASSGRSLQEEFEDFGLSFDCTVRDDITAGHLAVRELLEDPPRLIVTPNCVNIIQAFERYVFGEYRRNADELRVKETPREEYKDAMDVIRYMAMSDPRYIDLKQAPLSFAGIVRDMGLGGR